MDCDTPPFDDSQEISGPDPAFDEGLDAELDPDDERNYDFTECDGCDLDCCDCPVNNPD